MEIRVTQLRTPIIRQKPTQIPQIIFTKADDSDISGISRDQDSDSDVDGEREIVSDLETLFSEENDIIERKHSLPEVTTFLPEVTYGLKPRTAWMYRYMPFIIIYLLRISRKCRG